MTSTPPHIESLDAAAPEGWTLDAAAALYGIDAWGSGYFRINDKGHVAVTPRGDRDLGCSIDMAELVHGLEQRGLATPVLVRFTDVLASRMAELRAAFDKAIEAESYGGRYACVYPIKVNQQRHFVEAVRDLADPLGFGLEAGSKPELLAVLGLTENRPKMPIICNGFKDDEYIETVILAHKLGRQITPVVESFSELDLLLKHSKEYGVRPHIGVRIKPTSPGAGRWAESGGERSKFGLHAPELLAALEKLHAAGMADCLKLVHFHVGSQMCDIQQVKTTVSELARIYCELRRLGAGIETIDIGGGLGIDYDGSNSTWASSVNYSLEEYASDVVYRIKTACDDSRQPHPTIISESGRALVAHTSVLIFDVVGRSRFRSDPDLPWCRRLIEAEEARDEGEVPQPVLDLMGAWEALEDVESMEGGLAASAYHDALQARSEARTLFGLGYLSLPMRAVTDRLYWAIGQKILWLTEGRLEGGLPDQIDGLPEQLSDIYFCNFSLFQSLPDSWAIDQIFPIMPIDRLDEQPTRRAILADITCDSDGQISRFACTDQRDYRPSLELHELSVGPDGALREPYYMGIFLVGAYQEVLGDLHNLFGDTHAVHVSLDPEAGWSIDDVVEGDTVREVLGYVQFDVSALRRAIRQETERAVRAGAMTVVESRNLLRFYEQGLDGYTYLE